MQVVIDSCILVSGFDPKDVFHGECEDLLARLLAGEVRAVCPLNVLIETTCAIRRRTRDESRARAVHRTLADSPSILWLETTFASADRAALCGAGTGLRAGDAIIAQVAKEYNLPLVTKDEELRAKVPRGVRILEPLDVT